MADDLTAMMQEHTDAETTEFNPDAMGAIGRLLEDWAVCQDQLAEANDMVADVKARIKDIEESTLPAMMEEANCKKFESPDGSSITTKDELFISIKADKKEDTYEWLGENGHGSIVKHVIACQFGKGEDADAEIVKALLSVNEIPFADGMSVHAGTLKSWAKEERESGRDLPEEFFNTYEVTIAKIKKAK